MALRPRSGRGSRQPRGPKILSQPPRGLCSPRVPDCNTARTLGHDADIDYRQVARVLLPPPGGHPHAIPTPVATLAFDTSQELLWAGNEYVGYSVSWMFESILIYQCCRAGSPPSTAPISSDTHHSKHTPLPMAQCASCSSMIRVSSRSARKVFIWPRGRGRQYGTSAMRI